MVTATHTIRPAVHADHDAVVALWESAGLGRTATDEWEALIGGPTSAVLVAEAGGAIAGAGVATFDGWRAYIYHVAVSPRHRREGVGHDLMEEAEQYLVSAGARFVYVMVHEENTEGLALVGANGYLPDGDLVLTKPLASRA
jgi:ribosomal protein S18 acetylase RimI-like enzyme